MTTNRELILESKPCGRCGGSGRYSWCARHGSVCFGCAGRGTVLTKRGRVAQNFLNGLSTVRADQLRPGDTYREIGVTNGADVYGYWAKVVSVERDGEKLVVHSTSRYQSLASHMAADTLVRKGRTADEVAETRALALEFQRRLTLAGKLNARAIDVVI